MLFNLAHVQGTNAAVDALEWVRAAAKPRHAPKEIEDR